LELAGSVLRHPWNPAWLVEMAARAAAFCQFGAHSRHYHHLTKLRAANPKTVLLQGPHFRKREAASSGSLRKAG
jgi:hypothetical protein